MDAQACSISGCIGTGIGYFIKAIHSCGRIYFLGPQLRDAYNHPNVPGYPKANDAVQAVQRLLKADEKDNFHELEYSIVNAAGEDIAEG